MTMMDIARKVSAVSLVSVVLASPAFAGVAAPGPVVGAGLPALAAIGAGYYLIRKRRQR